MTIEKRTVIPTQDFQDFAELSRSRFDLGSFLKTSVVQEIRKHPKLRKAVETVVGKLGKRIDLA